MLKLAVILGCAAVWTSTHPLSIQVPLELTNPTKLENDLVTFRNPPADLKPPFCYPIDDIRFAYVQTLYYVTRHLRRLEKLGPFHRIEFSIVQAKGEMPAGGSQYRAVTFHVPDPAIDPTVIAHEIGHEIQDHLIGRDITEVVVPSVTAGNWRQVVEQMGVIEGVANLLSAFETGQSRVGAFSYADAPIEIDTFARFPDELPTIETALRRYITMPGFRALYPATVRLLDEQLQKPSEMLGKTLAMPDPYLASAAFNQPLWQAARRFGFAKVEGFLFEALRGYVEFRSYADFARRILDVTKYESPLHEFLESEFSRRRLIRGEAWKS